MENVYNAFYRKFYLSTGGFIPGKPLNQSIYPGDFFQIWQGEMTVLGNIFQNHIVEREDVEFDFGLKLNEAAWNFSEGVTKPYSGRGTGQGAIDGNFEFSRQLLSFALPGSHIFKCDEPESVKILNWQALKDQLIIKLTHTYFSFREIYLVTESASATSWSLAVSGGEKAELEITTEAKNYGLVDIFGQPGSKTIMSRDIEYNHRENSGRPSFFKVKKLIVHDSKVQAFTSNLIRLRNDQQQWAAIFYNYQRYKQLQPIHPHIPANAQMSVLDMMHKDQLNANNALDYFGWTDANMDDVEKLFVTYGKP